MYTGMKRAMKPWWTSQLIEMLLDFDVFLFGFSMLQPILNVILKFALLNYEKHP